MADKRIVPRPPIQPGVAQQTQGLRLRMPGMVPREIAIYVAWFVQHGSEFTAADYNVRVGTGFDPGPEHPQYARDSAIANTQKRVDAVLFKGDLPFIVEVKERATPYVIGQVMSYKILWMRDNPSQREPMMLVVCSAIDDDTIYCLSKMNIEYQLVDVDLSGYDGTKTT